MLSQDVTQSKRAWLSPPGDNQGLSCRPWRAHGGCDQTGWNPKIPIWYLLFSLHFPEIYFSLIERG